MSWLLFPALTSDALPWNASCPTLTAGRQGYREDLYFPVGKRTRNRYCPEAGKLSNFSRICAVIEIMQCLKKYGQRLDLEIAKEMGVPLAMVRQRLADLAATGAVIMCNLTRFENGKRIDAWQCRVSGYVPPLAPGRKSKPTS
jgi:hypothetical protein